MSWVATAIVGASVVSGYAANKASKRQAGAIDDATAATIEESRRQFDLVRGDTAPYRRLGRQAIGTLEDLNEGDFNAFYESPGYQFARDEGQKAIDRSLVARTGGLGGRAVKEGIRFAEGIASGEFSDFWNRVAAQAGIGQTGVSQSAAAGSAAAGQQGNAFMTQGITRGNAAVMGAQGINNAVQGGIQNYMLHDYLRPSSTNTGARPTSNSSTLNTWRGR